MFLVILLMISSFFHTVFADNTTGKNAERVLNLVEYALPSPSIIGEREWKELQLDHLVDVLGRTTTSFGRWGLVQLLQPIADKNQLLERKEIITFLVNNPDTMRIFKKQLKQVKRFEKSLLSYWDAQDQLNYNCNQFYFSLFGLQKLNKSSLALNASTIMEMFNAWKLLLSNLAFGGLYAEYVRWMYSDQDKFNIWRGLKEGFATPLLQHLPDLNALKYAQQPYTIKDYLKAFGPEGSPGDRYQLLLSGFDMSQLGLPKFFSSVVPGVGKAGTGAAKIGAFVGAALPTLFFDYQFATSIFAIGQRIVAMNRSLNQLQERISDVAHCVEAIIALRKLIVRNESGLNTYFNTDNYDDNLRDVAQRLLSPRFLQKTDYFYSRGHVLTMHLEIKRARKSLIPLLHSVALLDAYCSIAQLYNENKESGRFSFVEFVDSDEPFVWYQDAWLPLLSLNEAVVNNLMLGGNNPGKIIITGPNGGGKSTILKTYGIAAVLAQSWCIVPARMAKQSLFMSIKTGLSPQENLLEGLSTFMAEKKTMADIFDDMKRSKLSHQYMLALIDEPYKGTVDAESAKRIYQFGSDIAGFSSVLVALATHVKKPISLEADTAGIFGNYQVKIEETSPGIFKRLFKLEKGPALWWFEDEDKRSRFVDWISAKPV